MEPGRPSMLHLSGVGDETIDVYAYDMSVEIRILSTDGGAKASVTPDKIIRLEHVLRLARAEVEANRLEHVITLLPAERLRALRMRIDAALSDEVFE